MKQMTNFLSKNAGAIFCYSVSLMILITIILMDVNGIINITM